MQRRRRTVLIAAAAVVLVCALVALRVGWQGRNRPTASDTDDSVITLNVNEKGEVVLPSPDDGLGESVLTNSEQVRSYMYRLYDEDMKWMKPEDRAKGPLRRVVLRVDERANAEYVNRLAEACRLAGFSDPEIIRVREP
ncbi:MAG TPA: hypothetical protein VKE74_00335 [Gemmataceae bacterium]|nr:hypothetical protein [Gemmataceae bacterium]